MVSWYVLVVQLIYCMLFFAVSTKAFLFSAFYLLVFFDTSYDRFFLAFPMIVFVLLSSCLFCACSALLCSLLIVSSTMFMSWYWTMGRSHNFRPSYLRLRASLLRRKLNVQCILAMTATATTQTLEEIVTVLEIPSDNLIKTSQIRDNLQLSISMSNNR
jgi:hypothetical protein